jgi:hypothetical protein
VFVKFEQEKRNLKRKAEEEPSTSGAKKLRKV